MSRKKVFIIAEAGVNHNGDLATAKEMIKVAAGSGADAVKFQTFRAGDIASDRAAKAEYQTRTSGRGGSQLDMLKKLELDLDAHKELIKCCRDNGIMFLSTPFDIKSVDMLNDLGLDVFKIPSGEITNFPYLKKIGSLDKKVILSTGMSDMDEVRSAIEVLVQSGTQKEDITILHCNTEYPTPFNDVNLLAMRTMREELHVEVGYSDHTPGIEVAVAAVALGAVVIEKHFTLDKKMPGPDHSASLEPGELAALVSAIRNVETAFGERDKKPSPSELKNRSSIRKSIVASCPIKTGETFTEDVLAVKRPATGLDPMKWNDLLGKKAKRDFEKDEAIEI